MSILASDKIQKYFPEDSQTLNLYNDYITGKSSHFSHWNALQDKMVRMYDAYEAALVTDVPEFSFGTTLEDLEKSIGRFQSLAGTLSAGNGKETVGTVFIANLSSQVETIKTDLAEVIEILENKDKKEDNVLTKIKRLNQELTIKETQKYKFSINLYAQNARAFKTMEEMFESSTNKKLKRSILLAGGVKNYVETKYETMIQSLQTKIKELDSEFRKKIEQNRDVLLPKLLVEIDVTEQKNEANYSFVPMYHGFVVKHEGIDYICKRVDIDKYDDKQDSDPEQSLASRLLKTNDSEALRLLVLPRFSFIRNPDMSNLFPIVCEEYYLTTFGLMYSEKFSPSPVNGFKTRLFFKVCTDLFAKAGQSLLDDIGKLDATMQKVSIQIKNFQTFYIKQREDLGSEETIRSNYSADVARSFGQQVNWDNPYYEPIDQENKDYLDILIERAKQQINAISELAALNSLLEGLHDQLFAMVTNANDMIQNFSENGLPYLLTLFNETNKSISTPLAYLKMASAGDNILSDKEISKNALKNVSEIMGNSQLPGPKLMSFYAVKGHEEYEVIAKNMIFYAGNFYTTFGDAGTVGNKKDVTKHSPLVTPATLIPTDNKIDQISLAREIIYKNLNGPIHLMNLMLSNNDILKFLSADKKEFKERSIQFKNKQNVNDEESTYMLPYNTALDKYGLDKLTGSKSLHISQIFMALQLFMSKSIHNDYRLLISAPPGFGKSNIYYYTLRSLYEKFSNKVHTVYVFCTSATVENQYKQCLFSPAFLDVTLNNINPYDSTFQKFNYNEAADINPNLLENKSILETIKLISKDKGVVGIDGCYGNKTPELESVMIPYYDYINSFKNKVTVWMKSLFDETLPDHKNKQYQEKVKRILENCRKSVTVKLIAVFGRVSSSFSETNKLELKRGKNKALQKLVKIASLDQLKYMLYNVDTATIYKNIELVIHGFVDLYFKICDEDENYDILDLIKTETFTTELSTLKVVFESMNKVMETKKGKSIIKLQFESVEDCKAQRDVFEQMTRIKDVEITKEVSQGFKICFLHYDSCLALPKSEVYKHIQEGVQKDEDGQDSKISLIFDEVDYLFEKTDNDSQKTKDIKESLKNLLLESYQFSYVLGLSATIGSGPENMHEVLKGFRKKDLNMELFRKIWDQHDSEDNRKNNVYSLALNYANVGVMHLDNPTLINLLGIPPVFNNIKFDEHTKCTGKKLPGIFCVDTTPKAKDDAEDFAEADPAGKLKICQNEASINVPGKVIELMLALRSGKFSDPGCKSFDSSISSVIFASSNTFARQMAIAATEGEKFSLIKEVKIKNNKPDTPLHYRRDDVEIFYLSELIEYKDDSDFLLKEFTTAKCDTKLRMCFVSPFWARGVDFHNCQFVFKVNSPTDIFEDIELNNPNTGKCINVETSLQMDGRIRRRFSHAKTDALHLASKCETRCKGVGSYWILPTTPSEVYNLDDAYKMLTTVIETAENYHSITQSMTEASPCAAILYQLVVSDDRYLKALQRALVYVGGIEGSNLPSAEQIGIYFAEYKKKSDLIAFRSEDIVVPENIYLNSEQSDILKSLLSFMSA